MKFLITYKRSNRWDVFPQEEPHQYAEIEAVNRDAAISELANTPGIQSIQIVRVNEASDDGKYVLEVRERVMRLQLASWSPGDHITHAEAILLSDGQWRVDETTRNGNAFVIKLCETAEEAKQVLRFTYGSFTEEVAS